MARPYSENLGRPVLRAAQNQEGSQRQIAQRFQVSLTFVRNLLRHYRTTGTVNPKQHGGGPLPKEEKELLLANIAIKSERV
ncbi:helix-turn-helix domain-containing protein [Dapis sp. BLCC M229]|uniref:helix-turn-helix domain-containing protein n=1 Tax=Dapis sp. BLCC M229 TaxID=3400188 RepID=UPI003CF5F62C